MRKLLETVTEVYGLGRIASVKQIKSGYSRLVYKLTVLDGRIFAVHVGPINTIAGVENEASIRDQLSTTLVKTPKLLRLQSGEFSLDVGAQTATVTEWVLGVHRSPEMLMHHDYVAIGKNLAIFHKNITHLPFEHNNTLLVRGLSERFLTQPHEKPSTDFLLVASNLSARAGAVCEDDLASGILHGDFHLQNLIFSTDGIYILDFERSGPGILLYDIARAAINMCSTGNSLDDKKNAAFLEGYETIRPLSDAEKENYDKAILYSTLAVGQWFSTTGRDDVASRFLAIAEGHCSRIIH